MSKKQSRPSTEPERVHSRAYATEEELRALGSELVSASVSTQTRLLFARLASHSPPVRLSINLKTMLGLLTSGEVRNILTEGLTAAEHAALVELDLSGVSVVARESAHGLLNVHERWRLMKDLRRPFKVARRSKQEFIEINGAENEPSPES